MTSLTSSYLASQQYLIINHFSFLFPKCHVVAVLFSSWCLFSAFLCLPFLFGNTWALPVSLPWCLAETLQASGFTSACWRPLYLRPKRISLSSTSNRLFDIFLWKLNKNLDLGFTKTPNHPWFFPPSYSFCICVQTVLSARIPQHFSSLVFLWHFPSAFPRFSLALSQYLPGPLCFSSTPSFNPCSSGKHSNFFKNVNGIT